VFRYVNRARADRSRTARRETGVSRYVPRPTRAPLRPRRERRPDRDRGPLFRTEKRITAAARTRLACTSRANELSCPCAA